MEPNGAQNRSLTPPTWLIAWTTLAALAVFIYVIRSVLPPFVVGAVGAYIFSPVVESIQNRWRFPRWVAVFLLYVLALAPLAVLVIFLGPRFIQETRMLIVRTPMIVARLVEQIFGVGPYTSFGAATDSQQLSTAIVDAIRSAIGSPSNALHLVTVAAEFSLNAFLSLIVSIYLLADSGNVEQALLSFVPRERRDKVRQVSVQIHLTLARYLRRQLVLVAFVASATFLGLEFIFHLRYAVPIAVTTGLVEIIPFLGPVVAGTIAAFVALSQDGPSLMLGVIAFYFVLRQIEDQIVGPVVLGKAVELHPLIVIFSVLAGGALFGVLGTLAALPFAAAIKVIIGF
ncbi:MAG TPA: AI-2E family transporter, partial [Chloroflexota bacterium]|nr:AI-2E family transporter [Chloroflexota bacterium]